jgi:hypothetical protein
LCVLNVAQAPQFFAQTGGVNELLAKISSLPLWFADKTLQAVTKVINLATRTTDSKVAAQKLTSNVFMFSSLVRAFNVFSG